MPMGINGETVVQVSKALAYTSIGSVVAKWANKQTGGENNAFVDFFTSELFVTNAVIASLGIWWDSAGYDATKAVAAFWVFSLLSKLTDNASVDTIVGNKFTTGIAAVTAYIAYA